VADARSLLRKRPAEAEQAAETAGNGEGSVDGWGIDNIAAKRIKALATRGVVKKHVEIRPPKRHNEALVVAKL